MFIYFREIREILKRKASVLSSSINFNDDDDDDDVDSYNCKEEYIDNVLIPNECSFSELPEVSLNSENDIKNELVLEIRLLRDEEKQFRKDCLKFQQEKVALLKENNELLKTLILKFSKN